MLPTAFSPLGGLSRPHKREKKNQLMLNGALVIEMINNSFTESRKNLGRLIKQGTF